MNHRFSKHYKNKASILVFIFLLLFVSFSSHALLYKWIDDSGNIRYGDVIPQKYSNKKHFQLDAEGRIIMIKEAATSPEELKKARLLAIKILAEKILAEKIAKEEKEKQDRQDIRLLLTFNSVDDIFYARDQRLQMLDSKILLLKKNIKSSQKKLLGLNVKANELYLSKKQPVPGGLQQKIEQMGENILSIDGSINQSKHKRAGVITGFKKDLARFKNLKARQRKRQNEYH